jgi:hypothetical protein
MFSVGSHPVCLYVICSSYFFLNERNDINKVFLLVGWDKHSYGYHGDDGHSFCSSGTGQPYGPTFTTGDVIGCGVNLIDNTCFYTKNGHNLGIAFTDLPVSIIFMSPNGPMYFFMSLYISI